MARSKQLGVSEHTPHLIEIEVDKVQPNPNQPRRPGDVGLSESSIKELAENIGQYGLLQPIIVVATGDKDTYVLGGGQRRLLAVRKLGWPTVPAIEAKTGSAEEIALIENLQRQELHSVDAALAYKALMEQHQWTHAQLADTLKLNRVTLTEQLQILDLPAEILSESRTFDIPKTALIALARKKDDPEGQRELWQRMKEGGVTVRMLRGGRPPKSATSSGQRDDQSPAGLLASVDKVLTLAQTILKRISRVKAPLINIRDDAEPDEAAQLQSIKEERDSKLRELRDIQKEIGRIISRIEAGEEPEKAPRKSKAKKAAPSKPAGRSSKRGPGAGRRPGRPRKEPAPLEQPEGEAA